MAEENIGDVAEAEVISTPDVIDDQSSHDEGGPRLPDDDSGEVTKAEPTSRDAIERAFEKVDSGETDEEPEQAKETVERERDEQGRFKAKDQQPEDQQQQEHQQRDLNTPPQRFSEDAQKEWAKAPLSVRAEITRAVDELTNGIEQYQQAYEPFREVDNYLRQTGQNFQDVMARYVGIENMLASDPYTGLETICRNMGTSLQEVAEVIMGIDPDEQMKAQSDALYQLQQYNAYLHQQLNQFQSQQQGQAQQKVYDEVTGLANKDPQRFNELADDIAWLIHSGRTSSLEEAYAKAEQMNGYPVTVSQQKPQNDGKSAQTRKRRSVTGSPSPGSNPDRALPSTSARQSLDRAFKSAGLE